MYIINKFINNVALGTKYSVLFLTNSLVYGCSEIDLNS